MKCADTAEDMLKRQYDREGEGAEQGNKRERLQSRVSGPGACKLPVLRVEGSREEGKQQSPTSDGREGNTRAGRVE